MVCLGFEPGAAGWKARTNPLSYGGTPVQTFFPNDSFFHSELSTFCSPLARTITRKRVITLRPYWHRLTPDPRPPPLLLSPPFPSSHLNEGAPYGRSSCKTKTKKKKKKAFVLLRWNSRANIEAKKHERSFSYPYLPKASVVCCLFCYFFLLRRVANSLLSQ